MSEEDRTAYSVAFVQRRVLCQFLIFLFKNTGTSPRTAAAVAVSPQQHRAPADKVISMAVVLVGVAPDFKCFYTEYVLSLDINTESRASN